MMDSASKVQMDYICLQYPGYFCFAKWMERLAQDIADGVSVRFGFVGRSQMSSNRSFAPTGPSREYTNKHIWLKNVLSVRFRTVGLQTL